MSAIFVAAERLTFFSPLFKVLPKKFLFFFRKKNKHTHTQMPSRRLQCRNLIGIDKKSEWRDRWIGYGFACGRLIAELKAPVVWWIVLVLKNHCSDAFQVAKLAGDYSVPNSTEVTVAYSVGPVDPKRKQTRHPPFWLLTRSISAMSHRRHTKNSEWDLEVIE